MSSGPDDEERPAGPASPETDGAFRRVADTGGARSVPLREDAAESDGLRSVTDGGEPAARQRRAAPGRRAAVEPRAREAIRRVEPSTVFRLVRSRSRFDDLAVVRPTDGGRYADAIRARAVLDGEEHGVSVGLLDRPDDGRAGFAADVNGALDRWQAAGRDAGVVIVRDWAVEPRPWVATDPVGPALASWDRLAVPTCFDCALAVAEAVAGLHSRGVVHAGIDAGNVVARLDTLATTPEPVLTNVALMHSFREHFRPADYLDPRYAAPEYYDRSFGRIDQATELYGLGAVCWRLFTGWAPFDGSYDEVRAGVLGEEPVPPTARDASLPDPLDDVLAKALAGQKLLRYESATDLRVDLERVRERAGAEQGRERAEVLH